MPLSEVLPRQLVTGFKKLPWKWTTMLSDAPVFLPFKKPEHQGMPQKNVVSSLAATITASIENLKQLLDFNIIYVLFFINVTMKTEIPFL